MIDFRKIEYVVGFWWVEWPGADWLAFVYREIGSTKLTLTYRFRYYGKPHGTGDPFKDDDRKSWYSVTSDKSEREMIALTEFTARLTAIQYGTEVDYTEVRGTPDEAIAKLRTKEWCHMSTGDAPEPNVPKASA